MNIRYTETPLMTKAQQLSREVRSKRREITQLRDELANLQDHLLVVEARAKNAAKPTVLAAQARARLGRGRGARVAEAGKAVPLPEWHKRALDESLEEYRKNPREGSSWEEARKRILGRK